MIGHFYDPTLPSRVIDLHRAYAAPAGEGRRI